jgi:hypothetical protein
MSGGFSKNNTLIPSKLNKPNTNLTNLPNNFISPLLSSNIDTASNQTLSILQQFNPSNINMNNLAFSMPYQQIFQQQELHHQQQQQLQQNNNANYTYPYQLPFLFSFQNPVTKLNNETNLNEMVNNIMINQTSPQQKSKPNKEHPHHKSSNYQSLSSQKTPINLDTISGFDLEKKLIYQ